ncbi:MAG: hypothetical protein ACK4SZ_09730 [Allosphingosinicella sp.]|uniref:hypothetical protein n=1 Tax=Allosphingosinicella sp. TaxID=2823234 RepID=UPI00392A6907
MEPSDHNDEVITSDNRIVGCRGRVLVAVLILAALALILTATLFYRLFTWTPPVPRRAAIDTHPPMAAIVQASGPGFVSVRSRRPVENPNLLQPRSAPSSDAGKRIGYTSPAWLLSAISA